MSEAVVIFVTCASSEEAEEIGKELVTRKLAACANILEGVRSIFRWQGEICDEKETLMILKSRKEKVADVVKAVKDLHSYDVPEVIALPVAAGSQDYLDWVKRETD